MRFHLKGGPDELESEEEDEENEDGECDDDHFDCYNAVDKFRETAYDKANRGFGSLWRWDKYFRELEKEDWEERKKKFMNKNPMGTLFFQLQDQKKEPRTLLLKKDKLVAYGGHFEWSVLS